MLGIEKSLFIKKLRIELGHPKLIQLSVIASCDMLTIVELKIKHDIYCEDSLMQYFRSGLHILNEIYENRD